MAEKVDESVMIWPPWATPTTASTSCTRGPWYTVRRVRGWVVVWVMLPVATPMRTARPQKATELGVTCKARRGHGLEGDAARCPVLSSRRGPRGGGGGGGGGQKAGGKQIKTTCSQLNVMNRAQKAHRQERTKDRHRQTNRHTYRQAGRQAGRQTDRQAGRQTDRQESSRLSQTHRQRGTARQLNTRRGRDRQAGTAPLTDRRLTS